MEAVNESMHLFAGVGGGLLSDLIIGHKPIIAVEWDKYACKVLRERSADGWFPDLQVYDGDVRLFDPSEYKGRIHTLHAGFPCQDISNAGKQAGVGEGTRSGLYREALRIAGVVRPREIYLENVSAILSIREKFFVICIEKLRQLGIFGSENSESWAGKYIRCVIEITGQAAIGRVLGDLAAIGYSARWICIRASDVGANHKRDRWWLLAKLGNAEHDGQSAIGNKQELSGITDRTQEEIKQFTRPSDQHEKLAYSIRMRKLQPQRSKCDQRRRISNSGKDGAYTDESQSQGNRCAITDDKEYSAIRRLGWWESEPDVGRVANGIPARVGKLKGLGNAQVPLQAAVAYKMLERLF